MTHADRSNDEVSADAGKLRTPPARDWLIRFAFGAGVSALAGVVSEFAVVVALAATRWPLWATLTVATVAWAVIALAVYGVARAFGVGGDEAGEEHLR
jgi:hypothetical protein